MMSAPNVTLFNPRAFLVRKVQCEHNFLCKNTPISIFQPREYIMEDSCVKI